MQKHWYTQPTTETTLPPTQSEGLKAETQPLDAEGSFTASKLITRAEFRAREKALKTSSAKSSPIPMGVLVAGLAGLGRMLMLAGIGLCTIVPLQNVAAILIFSGFGSVVGGATTVVVRAIN